VFVVHSDERLAYEKARRTKAMERVRHKLEKLQKRVAAGKLKAADKIGAAAGVILARNHGHRYFGWAHENATFRFFEHPVHFKREQAYEGKYVIQTEEPDLSPVDAVRLYKQLADVDIDQSRRLSRLTGCGDGVRAWEDFSAQRQWGCPRAFEGGDGGGVGGHQLAEATLRLDRAAA
jgi:hypothetical protein